MKNKSAFFHIELKLYILQIQNSLFLQSLFLFSKLTNIKVFILKVMLNANSELVLKRIRFLTKYIFMWQHKGTD